MNSIIPLLVAVSGMPALGIAAWYARAATHPTPRSVALHWALIALTLFLGASGLHWASGSESRTATVAIIMVIAVNALIVSMVLRLRRRGR